MLTPRPGGEHTTAGGVSLAHWPSCTSARSPRPRQRVRGASRRDLLLLRQHGHRNASSHALRATRWAKRRATYPTSLRLEQAAQEGRCARTAASYGCNTTRGCLKSSETARYLSRRVCRRTGAFKIAKIALAAGATVPRACQAVLCNVLACRIMPLTNGCAGLGPAQKRDDRCEGAGGGLCS